MLYLQVEIYLDMVRDRDEWDALVHAVILAVEDHLSLNISKVGLGIK